MRSVKKWWIIALLAVAGAGACLTLILSFVLRIVRNELAWGEGDGVRQMYQLVGQSYGQGFVAGFFLCFSLILIAVAVSAWFDQRRTTRRATVMTTAVE